MGEENMNEQEVNQRFDNLVKPQAVKLKKEPAKFPELRYLWGITLLGSFVLIVISAVITTIIEAL
jgi:hypothetical protein